jgi:hypothetical protein
MSHHRLLEARRLAVAGEVRAIDALPRLPRQVLRIRARREARDGRRARYRRAAREEGPAIDLAGFAKISGGHARIRLARNAVLSLHRLLLLGRQGRRLTSSAKS